ncbi:MAG: substrate-binding domain-containing protein [Betaproteobacteria bacterium]
MHSVELQVLAGGALTGPMSELAALYESTTGQKIVLRFGTTPVLINLATTGGPFDLGVVPVDVMQDAAARARFAAGPTTDIARVGLGVAVRSGAPQPDISSANALKRVLLDARTVATIPASAGGTQAARVFAALGISEEMKTRIKGYATPAQFVQGVAAGEVDFGIFLRNVLTAPGLDVVGSVPTDLHQEVVFTAAVAENTTAAQAAEAFIAFLRTPAAATLLKARGMTPA